MASFAGHPKQQLGKSSEPASAVEDQRVPGLRPCPVGLRRHIFGSLKKAEVQWTELLHLLTLSQVETDDQRLSQTCQVVRDALHRNQPYIRHMSELYHLQPRQLKTVAEVFNPDRFGPRADHFGLRAGIAFDLELGWDLLRVQNQKEVIRYLVSERPGLVILSPPCTQFSSLQNLSYQTHFSSQQRFDAHLRELRDARRLLQFCVRVCLLCIRLQLCFVFEHPWGATSWSERCLSQLVGRDDTWLARGDQCMFGLESPGGDLLRKRSGFLTNLRTMALALNLSCDRKHAHQPVIGKVKGSSWNLSRLSQRYPVGLVDTILHTYAEHIQQPIHQISVIRHDEACDANLRIDSLVVEWTNSVNSELPTPVVVRDPQTAVDQCLSDLLHVYALEEPDSQPSEGGSEQPWSFPGTHPLSLESLVKRAHEGLGHPSKDRFLRILKYSKASDAVLKIAEKLKCSVCERFARPKPSRQGAPPREIGLNDMVGVDSVQIRVPFSQKKKFCLNVIDYHSHFQLMIPLADHTARAARQGYRQWLRLFGPPRRVLVDLGKEFKPGVCRPGGIRWIGADPFVPGDP